MKTPEKLRSAMSTESAYTARQLSKFTGVPHHLISACLSHDIKMGRVIKNYERPTRYRLASRMELVEPQIDRAIRLLRDCGYTVTLPGAQP